MCLPRNLSPGSPWIISRNWLCWRSEPAPKLLKASCPALPYTNKITSQPAHPGLCLSHSRAPDCQPASHICNRGNPVYGLGASRYEITSNMRPLPRFREVRIAALLTLFSCSLAAAQTTNPPYLAEMPAVDRVMQAMQASDPDETAARQMGALWQLKTMIEDISGPRQF